MKHNWGNFLSGLVLVFLWIFAGEIHAQNVVSVKDGSWNDPTTWSLPIIPSTATATSITVNHIVDVPAAFAVTIPNTTVNGTVTVAGTLNVSAAANTLTITSTGTLAGQNTGLIGTTNGNNVVFNSGATYRHQYTTAQGTVPLAQWNSNSNVIVEGYTTAKTLTAAGNWSQNFGNFSFQCASQAGLISFGGLLTSIAGDLTIASSGTSQLYLSTVQPFVLTVGGSVTITGANTRVVLTTTASPTLNIGRDLVFNATNSSGSVTSTDGQVTMNIGRDFQMNAPSGLLRIGYISSTGGATFNVGRNFNITAGTFFESSNEPGTATINFQNSGSHTFSNTGSIQNHVNYFVAANDVLTVLGESSLVGGGNSALDLAGTLVLSSTSANGALQNGYGSGPLGNVWVQNRTYEPGSIVTYGGSSPQFLGNGHPTASNVTTRISNASGVSLNNTGSPTVVLGTLELVTGTLTATTNSLTVQTLNMNGGNLNLTTTTLPRALTVNGNLVPTSGSIQVSSGTANTDVVIDGNILAGSGTIAFSGANARLFINGSGALATDFPLAAGTTTFKTITVARSGGVLSFVQNVNTMDMSVTAGAVDINAAKTLTVTNDLNLASGTTLFFEGSTVTLQRQFNNTLTGGLLSANSSSTLSLTGTGQFGTLAFSGSGNTVGTLTLNRPTGGTLLTFNSTVNVATTFNVTDGIVNNISGLQMTSGSTLIRTPNASFTVTSAAPGTGPYDVRYIDGTAPVTTSLQTGQEVRGSLRDVQIDLTGTCTVVSGLTVPGTLRLNTGTFANGGGLLTMGSSGIIARTASATYSGPAPSGGPYDVVYSGTTLGTQNEVRGNIRNLTSNVSGNLTTLLQFTIPGTVTINSGTLTIQSNTLTMGNLSNFVRNSGTTMAGIAPPGGPYNLRYIGTTLSSSVEAQGSLNNVDNDVTGTVTLSNPLTLAGTLSNNSGTWTSGANAITAAAFINGASFNAPSSTFTLTGNFTDNSAFTGNGGTVVFNGTSTLPGSVITTFSNIQLNASATLTFPMAVRVAGSINFLAGSIFNHGSGTITLNGAASQNIDGNGARFYSITVLKTGGTVDLLSSLPLANTLLISSATTVNSNGFLLILSQPDGPGSSTDNDGKIGPIATGGAVNGNVTVQRFLIHKGTGNRYVSVAVSGVAYDQLQDDFNVSAGYVRFYNEPTRGDISKGYTNVSSANLPFQEGRGYLAFMDADVDVTWDVTGPIYSGHVALPVSYTNAPNPNANADGWNLVGNPYASPIVWNNNGAAWGRTNVDPVITVYDVNGSSLLTYNYTNGAGNLPGGIIATGQAFWVHLSASGSLSVEEAAKTSAAGGSFFRTRSEVDQLIVSLSDGKMTDNSFLVLDENASPKFDLRYDGMKFKNETLNIYFKNAEGKHLVMDAWDYLPEGFRMPLEVQVGQAGEYAIRFTGVESFSRGKDLFLIDEEDGVAVPVSAVGSYKFSVAEATGKTISDRFYLSTNENITRTRQVDILAYPNPVRDLLSLDAGSLEILDINIFDNLGRQLTTGSSADNRSIDMRNLPNGFYLVKVLTNEGMVVKKIIKKD